MIYDLITMSICIVATIAGWGMIAHCSPKKDKPDSVPIDGEFAQHTIALIQAGCESQVLPAVRDRFGIVTAFECPNCGLRDDVAWVGQPCECCGSHELQQVAVYQDLTKVRTYVK